MLAGYILLVGKREVVLAAWSMVHLDRGVAVSLVHDVALGSGVRVHLTLGLVKLPSSLSLLRSLILTPPEGEVASSAWSVVDLY